MGEMPCDLTEAGRADKAYDRTECSSLGGLYADRATDLYYAPFFAEVA